VRQAVRDGSYRTYQCWAGLLSLRAHESLGP
jgi:hypothetical protein